MYRANVIKLSCLVLSVHLLLAITKSRTLWSLFPLASDECPKNRTFMVRRGYVHSPRFALDYPGDMECIWRIRVPNEHTVGFVFLAPINLDPNCTDFLEIRDGLDVTSPLLNRYCGSTPEAPPNVFSSGRAMFVRFKSDSYLRGLDGTSPGFRAAYFARRVKSGMLSCYPDLKFLQLEGRLHYE